MKRTRTSALAAIAAGILFLGTALPASANTYSSWTRGSSSTWHYWQAESGAVKHRHSLTLAEAKDSNTLVKVGIRSKYIVRGTVYTSTIRWGSVYTTSRHDRISQHQAASKL